MLREHEYDITCHHDELQELRTLLLDKRDALLRLLENPNLLEHDTFSELLWAVFHLAEELSYRDDTNLPDTDYAHVSGDIKRAYVRLLTQWLLYVRHLRDEHPYLFSLTVRTNPLNSNASVIVQ